MIQSNNLQRVSLILFKTTYQGEIFLLQQWDELACQYQLIGGGIENGESPKSAAIREMKEELPNNSVASLDGDILTQLNEVPFYIRAVSPTSNSITEYNFWLFQIKILSPIFIVNYSVNRWAPLSRLLDESSLKSPVKFYKFLDVSLNGGIVSIEDSIKWSQIRDFEKNLMK